MKMYICGTNCQPQQLEDNQFLESDQTFLFKITNELEADYSSVIYVQEKETF